MDLRQLNALLAVAEAGSFSAAARALHTVQSNVSTHVARLERELGVTLIDRPSGSLTEEGVAVVNRARRIQREIDALISDVASVHDEVAGGARLGMIGTTARWLVPPLLVTLQEQHPKLRLVVVDATTTSLVPQLVGDRLDLAVLHVPVDDPDLETERIFDEDPMLVAPFTHPLAAAERVSLADIARYPVLLEPQGTGFRDMLDDQATQLGIVLEPQAEIDGMRLLASLAFQGFGAAILPASAAPGWVGGDWKRVPIDGLHSRSVGMAWRRRGLMSAPARAVRDAIREVVAERASDQMGIHPAQTLLSTSDPEAAAGESLTSPRTGTPSPGGARTRRKSRPSA
jgi:DNA-binding transcriptional LysR family regulator